MDATGREKSRIEITQGDITEKATDAIVNAANNELILGAGVAGAIRRKGGPAVQDACNRHGPIQVGEAAITTGGNLKARHVIHAASMTLGSATTAGSLRSSTRASLELARDNRLRSIAFPAIGTGVAGFPLDECARIMLEEAARHLAGETTLERVVFVLFGQEAFETFESIYNAM